MKAQINLRWTLNNTTALQHGSAALAALALMALIGALLIYGVRPGVPVALQQCGRGQPGADPA